MLFFGGLVLSWIFCRHWNQAGFDAGARETNLTIGTVSTVILVTSGLVFSLGLAFVRKVAKGFWFGAARWHWRWGWSSSF